MLILTDENIPRSVVIGLRAAGHDLLWVKEVMRGVDDDVILARAMAEGRVVVTFDKDFGELAFRSRLPSTCGVVLFRITQHGREHDTRVVLDTLRRSDDWSGYFWTINDDRIRQRELRRRISPPAAIPTRAARRVDSRQMPQAYPLQRGIVHVAGCLPFS